MKSYTLGLDIGSKSIGWTLLRDKPKPSIVDIGVRVFPEGVDRDTKGAEKSKNATRREARGARRVHQRRNLRREKLIKTLRESGILPEGEQELQELLKKEPYQFRAKGLDEKLSLF
ncbi:MAG: type II CRISPR RNA-guided endonuclease Cas9, partial [Planctomycetota bacterium]